MIQHFFTVAPFWFSFGDHKKKCHGGVMYHCMWVAEMRLSLSIRSCLDPCADGRTKSASRFPYVRNLTMIFFDPSAAQYVHSAITSY